MKKTNSAIYIPNMDAKEFDKICAEKGLQFIYTPVQPHGKLIDANTLDVIGYCGIPQGCEDTFDSGVMWLAERIDELPTIIQASEDG